MIFRSLLQRLTITYFLLLTLVVGAVSYFTLTSAVSHLEGQISDQMLSQARLLAQAIREPAKELPLIVADFRAATGARLTIISPTGTVLADTAEDPTKMGNHLNRPEVQEALQDGVGQSTRFSTTTKINTKYLALLALVQGETGFVRVAFPLQVVAALKQEMTHRILWVTLWGALLTGGVVYLLLRNITQPLREITATSKVVASGDFSHRIKVKGAQEIEELADSFNYMASDLGKLLGKLTQERQRIEAILVSMVDGVLVADRSASITLINPAAEEIFQVKADQTLGKHILEVIRNYDLAAAFSQALSEDLAQKQELRLFSPNEMIVSVVITPVHNSQQQVEGAVAVIHDITALRNLEQMRTEFVSNVSHELKTPLTSIRGFTETLLDEELDTKTSRHFLEIIKTEAHRLSRLIQDLLDLSKLESPRGKLNLGEIHLPSVAQGILDLLHHQISDKGISVTLDFTSPFPKIEADGDMMAQVFLNLLENAVKYTPSGGKITISGHADINQASLAITDTGAGIPQHDLPRVFERFYRVDKARSRQLGGTGLGLAIVKHIIERHHGTISVYSRLGQGTTFHITLPFHQPTES